MTIRVLIADDHTLVAEGLSRIIEAEPDLAVVGIAQDGREAVRKTLGATPDVVLMDNAMPALNGTEATRVIRQRFPRTQVIIVSMYVDQAHVTRALQAGAMGYLLKQAIAKELVDAIRMVHAGRRYLSNELASGVLDQILNPPADPLQRLSSRERQVLQLVAEGRTSNEIAAQLALSPKTIETYRSRMMEKLGVHDLAALIKFAIQHGVISLEQ